MGLSIEDLDTCSPEAVDGVAASWERLSAAMSGDKASVDRDVIGPLAGAWISDDGRRAVQLIGYVGDQLEAVRAESGAMAAILREAAGKLRTAQTMLRQALDDARRNGITRQPDGRLTWTAMSDAEQTNLQGLADDIAKRITTALDQATAADELAALTMKANVDFGPKNDFNVRSLGADPTADARRAADLLLKLRTGELSSQDLKELKLLGLDNAADPAYSIGLVRDLGPDNLLTLSRITTQPWLVPGNGLDKDDRQGVQDVMRNALSAASADLAKDPEWMAKLRLACEKGEGDKAAPMSGQVTFGYQSLDTLLRAGRYDTSFLTQIGDGLLKFDKTGDNGRVWNTSDPRLDPVQGYLTTLKNNPEAATEFFGRPPVLDASGKPQAYPPSGLDHVKYLVNDHRLTPWVETRSPVLDNSYLDAFGDAVVVATSGHPTTRQMANATGNVIAVLGADGSTALGSSEELRSSVTEMLTNNVESLHLGLTQEDAAKDKTVVPHAGEVADIARQDLRRVLGDLTQELPNIQKLKIAEEGYTLTGLGLIAADSPSPDPLAARNFAQQAGEAFGYIDSAVSSDIRAEAEAKDKTQADANARWERWLSAGVDSGSAAVTARVAAASSGPGALLTAVATAGVNGIVGEYFQWDEPDNADAAQGKIDEVYSKGQVQVEQAVKNWAAAHPEYQNVRTDLVNAAGTGYTAIIPVASS
ncbi:hypothetical protein ACPA54_20095 [Uniformispora flossi]|uniref:hypothetical protein n=1 Tax=Uniformispora flossi TaxID=3390723 RepID=UPI003C2FC3DC